MKLSELIAAYGDDLVQFQNLDRCTEGMTLTKQGARATFVTPQTFGFGGFDKLGLVVWLDRQRVKEIVGQPK